MFKDFFSWSKNERRGIMLLSSLLILLTLGDVFFNRISVKEEYVIHPDSLQLYSEMLREMEKQDDEPITTSYPDLPTEEEKKTREKFDPNTLNTKGWVELGFSEKQSEALIRYKNSLGGFKKKDDLKNSYVISEAKFSELEKWIFIEEKSSESRPSNKIQHPIEEAYLEKNKKILSLDLNECDSLSLLELKGIGPFYAGKIIAYREQLGGYITKDQLLEIWKFDAVKMDQIADQIYISNPVLVQMNINSDSINLLKKHPYIRWNLAKAIVNYRKQHGDYSRIEDLNQLEMMNDSLFDKLYPYLRLD